MEKLCICSRVLYDIELLDKVKTINNLKKELNGPKPIVFPSFYEFQKKKYCFLYEAKKLIYNWTEKKMNHNLTKKDLIIRGLKTCDYSHEWHNMILVPQFNDMKYELIILLHEFFNLEFKKNENKFLSNIISNIFYGVVSNFYVFTELNYDYEEKFSEIIYTFFEKSIYTQLFLQKKFFLLICNNCGETDEVDADNLCFKCNFIKTF